MVKLDEDENLLEYGSGRYASMRDARDTCARVAIVSSFVPDSSFQVHSCGTRTIYIGY
jgi:hypothetical protein